VFGQHPSGDFRAALGLAVDRLHRARPAVLLAGRLALHLAVAMLALDHALDARVPHVVVHQDPGDLSAAAVGARQRVVFARLQVSLRVSQR